MMMDFTEEQRYAVACALRDWIHEQSFSQCNIGSDTCPDWLMAFEIRDIALGAITQHEPLTTEEIRVLAEHYAIQSEKMRSMYEAMGLLCQEWRRRLSRAEKENQ